MKNEIIPIIYFNGSGGNFLAHWSNLAKYNKKDLLQLSNNGNAHNNVNDVFFNDYTLHDPLIKVSEKVEIFKNPCFVKNTISPYFFAFHTIDIDDLNKIFKKIIIIDHEENDILFLGSMFCSKYFKDVLKKDDEFIKESYKNVCTWLSWTSQFLKKYKDVENILYLTVKDMLYNDATTLINKLSAFTKIPTENFSLDNLIIWREKNISGANEMKKLFQE